MSKLRLLMVSFAGYLLLASISVYGDDDRVSTATSFVKGDIFVAATVMNNPDDDHAGTGRIFQYDADLKLKGVLWIEGTTHKLGALTFAPDGVLWGFAPISWNVIEVGPDARQLPMRAFAPRTLNSVVFGPDGNLYFGEHLIGSQRKIAFNTTTFNYMPGTEKIGDGNLFKFSPDGRLLEEYSLESDGGMAGIHGNSSMVLVDNGQRAIYLSETGKRIMQFDLVNHRQLPDLAAFDPENGDPPMVLFMVQMADGRLAIATGNKIALLDSTSGEKIDEIDLPQAGWAAMTPSIDKNHLLIGNFFTGEFIKLNIDNGEIVARNNIGEERSLSGIAQFAGYGSIAADRYEAIIRESERAFMARDIEGAIRNLDENYVMYEISEAGPEERISGKENVRRTLGQFFDSNTSWVDSEVDKWGLLDNILVQVEYDSFETEDGLKTIPTLVVFEHRDGKRWREWRFRPRDR